MPAVIGAQTTLTLSAVETTYGTAPAGNWTQVVFTEATPGLAQGLDQDPFVLGSAATRDAGQPFLGEVSVEGRYVIPLNTVGTGIWMRRMFGPALVTNNSPNFTHRWLTGAFSQPSFATQIDMLGVTNRYQVISGMRVDSLEVDFSPTGAALATLNVVGQGAVRQASSAAGTPVLSAGANFQRSTGAITLGSFAAQVTGATMRISNNIAQVRTIRADRRIEEAEPGIATASGTITARFTDTDIIAAAVAGTPASLLLTLTHATENWVDFFFPNVFLSVPRTEVTGPQGVQMTFDWVAAAVGIDALGRVRLRNQVAEYT